MHDTRGRPIRPAAVLSAVSSAVGIAKAEALAKVEEPKAAPAVQYGGIYETAGGGISMIRRR